MAVIKYVIEDEAGNRTHYDTQKEAQGIFDKTIREQPDMPLSLFETTYSDDETEEGVDDIIDGYDPPVDEED